MSDDDIDERERREAEALRVALERGRAEDDLPEEALSTAALLRHSADGSELSVERMEALLPDVLEASERARARRPEPAPRVAWWRWVLGLTGVTAAALILLIVLRPGAVQPTALPSPGPALLTAQMERAGGRDDARFDAAMRAYRGEVFTALTDRYAR